MTFRWEREIDERNRALTDDELDSIFPSEGYKILDPPANYAPVRTPIRRLQQTPTPLVQTGFRIQVGLMKCSLNFSKRNTLTIRISFVQVYLPVFVSVCLSVSHPRPSQIEDKTVKSFNDQPQGGNLPFLKQEDIQYFDKLLTEVDEDTLSPEELKVCHVTI